MTQNEAVQAITAKVLDKKPLTTDMASLGFDIEKLVVDILDYCHRDDFPASLVYTAADLVCKRLDDDTANADGVQGPLKSLQEDDVKYEWAVNSVSATGLISDADFESIWPKLNRWRKVIR